MPRAKNEADNGTPRTRKKPATRAAAESRDATQAPSLPAEQTPFNAEEEIRRRAYELYEQSGRQHGRDQEHWLRAEAEILGRASKQKSA